LALSVGKNQMCNLCGWLFFQLAPNVQYKKRRAGNKHFRFGLSLS
jgi:hypothetical protein